VMLSGTMRLNGIVAAQGGMWFAVTAPLAALVFLTASLAEVARAPFELLEAESEIVAGFHIEYSGIRFGMFFAAEFLHAFTIGALIAVLFLGGWQGPGAQDFPTLGAVYFVAKSFAAYFLLVWVRATLPRIRIDRMLDFCWKVLTPAMIVLIGAIAVADRALADSPFWLRQGALLGVNVIVAAAAIALLGRRPHPHPLAPSPSAGIPRERGKGSGAGGTAGETAA
jgi:NADH-quinone oxidoreductase subunit H